MRIRMAERVVPADAKMLEKADHACRWCGFRCVGGTTAYLDDDGPSAACSVCLSARHAGALGPAWKFAWIPEIAQIDLAHLYRVMAVIDEVHLEVGTGPKRGAREDLVASLLSELSARRRVLDPFSEVEGGIPQALDTMDAEQAEILAAGLRVVPISFEVEEIDLWLDGRSSLSGYGHDILTENDWFRRSDVLLPVQDPPAEKPTTKRKSGKSATAPSVRDADMSQTLEEEVSR